MKFRTLPRLRRQHWFFSVIAMLAMASQFVLAIAPLAEGREDRMASHVEAGGTQTHYAHSDGRCVSCQARSIHGTTPRSAPSNFEGEARSSSIILIVDRESSADVHFSAKPRAPPRSV
jgi:hypothetical protein